MNAVKGMYTNNIDNKVTENNPKKNYIQDRVDKKPKMQKHTRC